MIFHILVISLEFAICANNSFQYPCMKITQYVATIVALNKYPTDEMKKINLPLYIPSLVHAL